MKHNIITKHDIKALKGILKGNVVDLSHVMHGDLTVHCSVYVWIGPSVLISLSICKDYWSI